MVSRGTCACGASLGELDCCARATVPAAKKRRAIGAIRAKRTVRMACSRVCSPERLRRSCCARRGEPPGKLLIRLVEIPAREYLTRRARICKYDWLRSAGKLRRRHGSRNKRDTRGPGTGSFDRRGGGTDLPDIHVCLRGIGQNQRRI